MAEMAIVQKNSSAPPSNNNDHDSNTNISDNTQPKIESTSISNDDFESSKTPIQIQTNHSTSNASADDTSNTMLRSSMHDTRTTSFSRPNYRHQTSSSSQFTPHMNQSETQAQLVAFTPPLMSLQLPYQECQSYQQNHYSTRSHIQNRSKQQSSLSTKSKSETGVSQPEYYVDSFAPNFSDKPSSNSNNKTKTKHVTFQEPEMTNESSKTNSNDINFSPSSSPSYWSSPVHRYPTSRSSNRYNHPNHYYYPPNEFYSPYPGMTMDPRFIPPPHAMNMMSTPPVWQPQSYYFNQQPSYVPHLTQPRQLYDPNKPKVPSASESHDSLKVIRNIPPKNKKKTKQPNSNDSSIVPPPESVPHPITILRKPSTDTEITTLPVKHQPVFLPKEEEKQQQQPIISSDIPPKEELTIDLADISLEDKQTSIPVIDDPSESNTTISLPSHELLFILQSANCISSLNEYAQQKKFPLNYEFPSTSSSSYTCIVSINGRQFPASSPCLSKNEAQKLACDQAVRILYRESCTNEQSSLEFSDKHDYIAHRSVSTFQNLNVNDLLLGRKTLACMLMITDNQFEQARVISIATGNGCLDETNLTYADDGTALHDCHAEILARRGLIKFFFQQIKQSKDNKSSIFEYNSTINKYQLHENITFHMYISSLPCGNASLNISSNSIRYKQGQIEGTLLASTSSSKYPIKSCSDKICRWNILGIQGGLLINFLTKPIYLETITIARETTFDRNHIRNSLCEHLKEYFPSLPSPFLFHIPDIDCPKTKSFQQERQVAKLQTNAFAWNITQPDRRELLEPMTGRLKNDRSISSLSKQNLLEDFTNFLQENSLTYQQAKQLNKTYVSVKNLISTAFQTGSSDINISWLSKSDQLEQFSIQ